MFQRLPKTLFDPYLGKNFCQYSCSMRSHNPSHHNSSHHKKKPQKAKGVVILFPTDGKGKHSSVALFTCQSSNGPVTEMTEFTKYWYIWVYRDSSVLQNDSKWKSFCVCVSFHCFNYRDYFDFFVSRRNLSQCSAERQWEREASGWRYEISLLSGSTLTCHSKAAVWPQPSSLPTKFLYVELDWFNYI